MGLGAILVVEATRLLSPPLTPESRVSCACLGETLFTPVLPGSLA